MIIGAGYAGLLAAHAFPQHRIIEAQPEPQQTHKALLRFRSTAVADLVGIDFRPVTVRKGIWREGFQHPTIELANLYSKKVIGRVVDRSIWNLETVTRYIAPEDLYEQMLSVVRHRIEWGVSYEAGMHDGHGVINTAPLSVMLRAHGLKPLDFKRAGIHVQRWRIKGWDVHQTVYFPSPEHSLYRASITGDLLICEFVGVPEGEWLGDVQAAFAFPFEDLEPMGTSEQKYGKIAPADEGLRQSLIAELTRRHEVFSLGRFATWRNILLDDVIKDIFVVKKLMHGNHYERRLIAAK